MKKRILICDDDDAQFKGLKKNLKKEYDIHHVDHYSKILAYLREKGIFNLLILDLGYKDEFGEFSYIGQSIIPDIEREFPNQKILIYSRIFNETDHGDNKRTMQKLLSKRSIVDGMDPSISSREKKQIVDEAIGGPSYLRRGEEEIWILHLSDLQFGGPGLKSEPETLAHNVINAIRSFVKVKPEPNEHPERKYPTIIIASGDISQTSSPHEYELAQKFFNQLSSGLKNLNHTKNIEFKNLINSANIMQVPGNHDFNWSVSRARSIHEKISNPNEGEKAKKVFTFKQDIKDIRIDLEYIEELSRIQFNRYVTAFDEENSFIKLSYRIYNRYNEIGIIFILLDSTRFENHCRSIGMVKESVLNSIKSELDRIDPQKKALRVMIAHHTLDPEANKNKQLQLESGDRKELLNIIRTNCNISLVLTGHLHEFNFSEIVAPADKKILHFGSGTLRSSDLNENDLPKFTLLRIWDFQSENERYNQVTVYPFSWNMNIFQRNSVFNGGQEGFKDFNIEY